MLGLQPEAPSIEPNLGLTDEQLHRRRGRVTGSLMGAILGLDPWKTPMDAWLQITGRVDTRERSDAMEWGQRLEHLVVDAYAQRKRVRLALSDTLVHPKLPWLAGTPDRLVIRGDEDRPVRGVEAKVRGFRQAWRWGRESDGADGVPDDVQAQCAVYMALTDLDRWDVCALIDTSDFRVYELHRDLDTEAALLEVADRFYREHVLTDVPPPLDGGEGARQYLRRRFPGVTAPARKASAAEDSVARDLAATKAQLKDLEKKADKLTQELCAATGDTAGLRGEGFWFSWQARAGNVRWKTVADELATRFSVTDEELVTLAEQSRGESIRVPMFKTTAAKENA